MALGHTADRATLEHHVRVDCLAPSNLGYRNTRRSRLKADRPLLFIRSKSLRLANQNLPRSVHYRWWTLSVTPHTRQTGRVWTPRLIRAESWALSGM